MVKAKQSTLEKYRADLKWVELPADNLPFSQGWALREVKGNLINQKQEGLLNV